VAAVIQWFCGVFTGHADIVSRFELLYVGSKNLEGRTYLACRVCGKRL
jgi:hypothetical protein